eukprot:Hpha_TRINITY_DN7496_c0_g2::TRINITY_DN7496_c0_g2_i1::g.95998::m.95998
MSGLLIFARVDPKCAGPRGREGGLVPLELEADARVNDITAELAQMKAIRGVVGVQWQGRYLDADEFLADVGLCPQSTVVIVPREVHGSRIAAGERHTVALRPGTGSHGGIHCWGNRASGKLAVPVLPCGVAAVFCGREHSGCLLEDGRIKCWGYNRHGEAAVPARKRNFGRAVQVSAGECVTMALLEERNKVVCWGSNYHNQCDVPRMDGTVVQISAGESHMGALLEGGTVKCWGDNRYRQCEMPDDGRRVAQISCG